MSVHVFTAAEFKSFTGRSNLARIFKTKGGLSPIIKSLKVYESYGDSMNYTMARGALRAVRKNCAKWLKDNEGVKRSSKSVVEELVKQTTKRTNEMVQAKFGRFSQQRENEPVGDSPKAVPKPAYLKDISGEDISRVGNQMGQHLNKERAKRHWGPDTQKHMTDAYTKYKTAGGQLTIGAFADHIYIPNLEDDPSGKYLGQLSAWSVERVRSGVKYCTPDERKRYALTIENGLVKDYSGNLYDTSGRETEFSKFGWAIFVLGFDNVLYSNTHRKDLFHHSSFFAGNPVQCGGEICCIAGRIRYVSSKTGHYHSGPMEFYRFLSFLNYNGVCLANVFASSNVELKYGAYWRANKVYAEGGKTPTVEKTPPRPRPGIQPRTLPGIPPPIPTKFGRTPARNLRTRPRHTTAFVRGETRVSGLAIGPKDKPRGLDQSFIKKPDPLQEPGVPAFPLPPTPVAPSVEACRQCSFMCPRKMAA